MDNEGNGAAQKVSEESPGAKLKGTIASDFSDRAFKMAVMKNVNAENSELQFNELRDTIKHTKNGVVY